MAWKKGQSGNPSGRPKAYGDFQEECRKHTSASLKTLTDALKSDDERLRLVAAEALLDRGWGKPPTVKTGEGGEGVPTEQVNYQWQQPHPLTPQAANTDQEANSSVSIPARIAGR